MSTVRTATPKSTLRLWNKVIEALHEAVDNNPCQYLPGSDKQRNSAIIAWVRPVTFLEQRTNACVFPRLRCSSRAPCLVEHEQQLFLELFRDILPNMCGDPAPWNSSVVGMLSPPLPYRSMHPTHAPTAVAPHDPAHSCRPLTVHSTTR